MNDLVLKFTGLDRCPDEPEVIKNRADVHTSGELDDTGDVVAKGQVIGQVAWHRGTVVGDQHTVIGFDPDQDVRIGCALDWRGLFADQVHAHGRLHLHQLDLDEGWNMLIEQETNHTQAETAV